jgi:hypothetical protein
MPRLVTGWIPKRLTAPPCVKPTSAQQRAAWEAAAAEAGETVSDLVRAAVDRELERRREAQARAAEREDPFGLEAILERLDLLMHWSAPAAAQWPLG